ncbi:MAG: hypothetical protein GQ533_00740 [Methanosarcinaceae archaeon]|nr:hypothetical protein [Methanosarcinaceae archaeon]
MRKRKSEIQTTDASYEVFLSALKNAKLINYDGLELTKAFLHERDEKIEYSGGAKKTLHEWYIEMITLAIGGALGSILTEFNNYLFILIVLLFITRFVLYFKTGK